MKEDLRVFFREQRDRLSLQERKEGNEKLVGRVWSAFESVLSKSAIGVYYPVGSEASIQRLYQKPFRFYLPRIGDKTSSKMDFHLADFSNLEKNAWGIPEPKPEALLIDSHSLDLLFIPLLAFDAKGGRLGQGKGFYDRYLDGFIGKKIGLAYDCQLSEKDLPMDTHDHYLDMVITPTTTYQFLT